jgi:hypothetical protein
MQTVNPNPQNAYSLQQLSQHIQLFEHITGKKPEQITVSQPFMDWFHEQVQQVIKNFNIPTTKNFKRDEFMGVELVVKQ